MARSRSSGKKEEPAAPFTVHGWALYLHPCILDQIERLAVKVAKDRAAGADPARPTTDMKLLAAIRQIIFDDVPQDPGNARYRQGGTLGAKRKHWFRAKFGNGRFRLFYRYSTAQQVIVFAWVNDSETLRTYGSPTDAYAVFAGMLSDGNPPDDWAALKAAADTPETRKRAKRLL